MCSADLAPVHSEFVSKLIRRFGLRNEGDLLPKVEIYFILRINAFDFDQTNIVVLVS